MVRRACAVQKASTLLWGFLALILSAQFIPCADIIVFVRHEVGCLPSSGLEKTEPALRHDKCSARSAAVPRNQ